MAYIYLEELEKILPGILDQWIDKDDESWEWIFQEIEQKCHVGKKKKDKKPKKKDMQNAMEIAIMAHRNDINELTKKVDVLNNKISNLDDRHAALVERVNHIRSDITAAKSMAEIAKQRTEVDYSKYSGKSDGKISYGNKCASCKHISLQPLDQPCAGCCYNGTNISGMDKWEAKDE